MGIKLASFGIVPVSVTYYDLDERGNRIEIYKHNEKYEGEHTEPVAACPCKPAMKYATSSALFKFRRRSDTEAQTEKRDGALPNPNAKKENESSEEKRARLKEETLSRATALLVEAPQGFDDWDTTGSLAEQIRSNFDNDDARTILNAALNLYQEVVYPIEFFRTV
jgi:hypothetical protein